MSVPPLDSLDRFLELYDRVRNQRASAEEKLEWQNLVRTLLDGEVGARARRSPAEGRRHVRSSIRLLARITPSRGPAATVSLSLGTGGFRVYATLPYENGAVLEVAIPLPEVPESVRALAKVAWRRTGSFGLELLEMEQTDRDLLESAVVEAMLRSR
jgi:hypothetical protein